MRCMSPIYDDKTGELIDDREMKKKKDLEVEEFWLECSTGGWRIVVKLESEDE